MEPTCLWTVRLQPGTRVSMPTTDLIIILIHNHEYFWHIPASIIQGSSQAGVSMMFLSICGSSTVLCLNRMLCAQRWVTLSHVRNRLDSFLLKLWQSLQLQILWFFPAWATTAVLASVWWNRYSEQMINKVISKVPLLSSFPALGFKAHDGELSPAWGWSSA